MPRIAWRDSARDDRTASGLPVHSRVFAMRKSKIRDRRDSLPVWLAVVAGAGLFFAMRPASAPNARAVLKSAVLVAPQVESKPIDRNDAPVAALNEARPALRNGSPSASSMVGSSTQSAGAPSPVLGTEEKLQQIVLGLYGYEFAHEHFPPAVVIGPDGKTPHSWRVEILPYLHRKDLFEQYRLDEPWDSPANKKVLDQIPDVFGARMTIRSRPTAATLSSWARARRSRVPRGCDSRT